MNQTVRNHIRRLDITDNNSGFDNENIRIDMINHPVLIIGLGGTGTDALLRVKSRVYKRFAKNGKKPNNIEFLTFETNEHDKKKYEGISLEPHEMILLSNAGIGAILNNRSTLPEYISDWLAPELTITDGTKGASGNRQAGRLLLFEKINSTIDAIDNKIRTLRLEHENKLLVFILTGLSGGTGGGMFLDIAYIVRGLMERDYGAKGIDRVDILGYLFSPDVHIAGNALNIHTEEYIKRNGYASLKELDYWMNIEERNGERFTQRYGTRLTVNSGLPPFNLCHLVSATNIDGVYLKNAYDFCLDVNAENIVNFLAHEEKSTGQEFAIHDYNNNLLANIATMKSGLPESANHSANYVYNIIGASAAYIPTEEINTYTVSRLFNEIDDIFYAAPDTRDLKEFTLKTKLNIETLSADFARKIPPLKLDYEGTDFYSYVNTIQTRRVDVDEKLNEQYTQIKAFMLDTKNEITDLTKNIQSALRELFLNSRQGPLFTSRLIESDSNPCLLPWIETNIELLSEKQQKTAEDIEIHSVSAVNAFETAKKALFFTREKKKNTYIAAKIREYQSRLQMDFYGFLINIYKAVHTFLETENNRIYAKYSETLAEIKKTLTRNENPVKENSSYGWRIVEAFKNTQKVDEQIKNIGKETLTKHFLKTLVDNNERWLNDTEPGIVGVLSEFVYEHFGTITARPMEEYISEEQAEEQIAPRLHRDALPVFHLDNAIGLYHFPSYGMVSVPANAPSVLRGIERYRANALSGLKFNVRRSKISDRIFWLNTQNGVPLFAYTPLRVYEELYERTIFTKEGVGRHFWSDLPSPLPESTWGETYVNARQKAENDRIRAVFAEAIQWGSITVSPNHTHSRYVAILREDFDPEPYFFNESTDAFTIHDLTVRLRTLQNNGGLPITEKRPLFNSPTEELALAHFLRNPKLVKIVESENKKHINIANTLESLVSLQTSREGEKSAIDALITALACEALIKQNGQFVYNHTADEEKWPPVLNLLEKADTPEHALFVAFKAYPFDKRERIKRRAKTNHETFPEGKLLTNLRKWQNTFTLRKETLEKEENPVKPEIYDFYRNGLLRINTQIAAWV